MFPYITPRLGYYKQTNGGSGNALIGVFPLRVREVYDAQGLYGGLEVGVRFPLELEGVRFGSSHSKKKHKTSFTISVVSNYEQFAIIAGFMYSN